MGVAVLAQAHLPLAVQVAQSSEEESTGAWVLEVAVLFKLEQALILLLKWVSMKSRHQV
jgi:hypothetical protein